MHIRARRAYACCDLAAYRCRLVLTGLLTLALTTPGPVYPRTMDQLLSLSLERLLQLDFSECDVPHCERCSSNVSSRSTDCDAR